ncbi:hypothetical protein [Enterococcus gallinarum]|uniref:hypothetical protein n=1 Tax=Enterococcus TaxID=1350 RepID=UPI003F774EA0
MKANTPYKLGDIFFISENESIDPYIRMNYTEVAVGTCFVAIIINQFTKVVITEREILSYVINPRKELFL